MGFGNRLRQLRIQHKLSQNEIADQIGVCQSTYHAWENDRSLPSVRYYLKLVTVLGISPNELIPDGLTGIRATSSTSTDPRATHHDPVLNEALMASQKQVILLQQQYIEHLEAENKCLWARLT